MARVATSAPSIGIEEIASIAEGEWFGDASVVVTHVATLESASAQSLAFINSRDYLGALENTRAGCVLLKPEYRPAFGIADTAQAGILVADPYLAYAKVAQRLYPEAPSSGIVAASAQVDASATLGEGVEVGVGSTVGAGAVLAAATRLGPHVHIGDRVRIGEGSKVDANVVIEQDVQIGKRCHIASGSVIGADGFGFAPDASAQSLWVKIPQIGSVVIGDDVHIGANTCVDRGAIGDTIIGDSVILDNLIQIAHNVVIGKNTAIAGCAAVAGSTRIGENCLIGGRAAIVGHLTICDGVQINANSLVTKSIAEPGIYSSAWPAQPAGRWARWLIRFRKGDA